MNAIEEHEEEDEREAKKQRQKKKMTKILIKAWNLDDAQPFLHAEELSASDMEHHKNGPMNLTSMGEKLDTGEYEYGKTGWESFASDLSWIYRRFIMSGKHSKLAERHLGEIQILLENAYPSLSDMTITVDTDDKNASSTVTKKRLASLTKEPHKKPLKPEKPSPKKKGRTAAGKKKTKTKQAQREVKSEISKLQKELDKALKAHEKASKNLESFLNETHEELHTMEEDGIQGDEEKDPEGPNPRRILGNYDYDIFHDMPSICAPDILMVWDFLCTFSRTLSLEPIGLDDFVKTLLYSPKPLTGDETDQSITPLYLAEAHLALLKLLLSDVSSDDWWWSMVESVDTQNTIGMSTADSDSTVTESHYLDPVIRIDILSLLLVPENPAITNRWLQVLDNLLQPKKISFRQIKSSLKSAMTLTSNKYVKLYLYKCIQKRRSSDITEMKAAIGWLIARVRQARLDSQDLPSGEGTSLEHIQKVAQESAHLMEQLPEDDEDDIDLDALDDWDDDSDSEDDSESETEEDYQLARNGSSRNPVGQTDESSPVTSSIPELPSPSLIDILLPSNKHTLNSEILSPFTWPPITGIVARRILHRLKWLRNDVDDSLREFREKPRLTIAERKRRESLAPFRILSESISVVESGDHNPLESAISHLCDGKPYLDLRPVQRLCLLRLLVEASYDTSHIYNCIQDNIKSRTSAEKSLEQEERQLKKEAKEEAALVEESARSRLLQDAKCRFIERKRKELAQNNSTTTNKRRRGYSEQQILNLSDEQISVFDEDTRAAFEALNVQSFSKSEVSAMVNKINDENVFGKKSVEILTLEEIMRREEKELSNMLEELASYNNTIDTYDRSVSARVEKLRREINNFQEWLVSLPKLRSEAIATLKDAIQDGTMKVLKAAIRNAKEALLMGDVNDGDGIWALDLLRDAYLELKAAERRKRVIDAQKDLIGKRNKCFVRTEPIGSDRFLSKYWHFDHDVAGRLWVETDFDLEKEAKGSTQTGLVVTDKESVIVGPGEEEEDLLPSYARKNDSLTKFLGQEYHPSGFLTSLVKRSCGFYITENSLRSLIKNMDSARKREASLKEELKKILESSGAITSSTDASSSQQETIQYPSDHDDKLVFQEAKAIYLSSSVDEDISVKDYLLSLSSAIGQDILLSQSFSETAESDDNCFLRFKVTGWKMKTEADSLKQVPRWFATSDAMTDVEISSETLFKGLERAAERGGSHNQGDSSSLSDYRNKLGKFCGRAADAPYSMTVFSLSKLLLKREQDLYPSLKCRLMGTDNHWGGKNGLKNAWIVSLRDYGDRFDTVKDCCLLLEAAFFEFCGGVADNHSDDLVASAMQLLNDTKGRRSVALEVKGPRTTGLWNSKESRLIFRELVSSCKNVGTLALCIELLCTNCRSYLEVTKANARQIPDSYFDSTYAMRVTRGTLNSQSVQQPNGPRRMNTWQQQQQAYY